MRSANVCDFRVLIAVAAIAAAAFLFATAELPVHIRYSLPEEGTWWRAPQLLAEKWGLFRDESVVIDEHFWSTGKRAQRAMLEDEGDVAFAATPPILRSTESGEKLVILAQTMTSPQLVRLLTRKERVDDWFAHPIGLARNTMHELYLAAHLRAIGKLDIYRDGKLALIDRSIIASSFITLAEKYVDTIVAFQPFVSILTTDQANPRAYVDITKPVYDVACYIVTTPSKWRQHRVGIIRMLAALRRAGEEMKSKPKQALSEVRPLLVYGEQLTENDWNGVDFSLVTDKAKIRESLEADVRLGLDTGFYQTRPDLDKLLAVVDDVNDDLRARRSWWRGLVQRWN